MMKSTMLFAACLMLLSCGSPPSQPAPFEGHWRKYDDETGKFIDFKEDQVTLGDKQDSRNGSFTYEAVNEVEPLFNIRVFISGEEETFQLYYERDTISLISENAELEGLYEINFQLNEIDFGE